MRKSSIAGAALLLPLMVSAARISGVEYEKRGSGIPQGLSGVTYAGEEGGRHVFYAVADNGDLMGLYKVTVPNFTSAGGISGSVTVGSRIALEGAKDVEGVAYDPASGNVWVADEGRQTITEYDLAGKAHRKAPVPAVMGLDKINANYGFESLTISGDGLTMWTANEEALKIDGERSAYNQGTTVRLVKFSRTTVHDDWLLSGMYAYTTDGWSNPNNLGGSSRRGVSDLCALPDGSLLVLERELSSPTADKEDSEARYAIYNLSAKSLAAATDIRSYDTGLKGRTDWTAVSKGGWLLGQVTTLGSILAPGWVFCESICLGPRVSADTSILFGASDAGDGYSRRVWMGMPLLDLNIQTLDFTAPSADRSSIFGKNYRFLDGTDVSVELTDSVSTAYPVNGKLKIYESSWKLDSQGASGEGKSASFKVASSGTFVWSAKHAAVKSGYLVADSFEGCRPGSTADEIGAESGWAGEDALVEARTYDPPVPPGFVMTNETHAQVLNAAGGEAVRSLSTEQMAGTERMDVMVRACRPVSALGSAPDDALVQIAMDGQGRLCLWHLYEEGGVWKKGWTPLSEKTYAEGEWIRVEADFDYTSSPGGDVFVCVRVNGSYQPTSRGFRSPTDTICAYGPWHCIARGGGALPGEIAFSRTEVDDLMVRTQAVEAEHTGPTEVDGIPFGWFDGYGMPRDPNAPAPFLKGYTLRDFYNEGADPYSTEYPQKVSAAATPYEGYYDGDGHLIEVSFTVPEGRGEATVAYSYEEQGEYVPPEDFVKPVNATTNGPVTVYARVSAPLCAPALVSATVTIRARPVTLAAGSATKPFDGTPLVCGEWSVKDGGETPGYGFVGEEGVASLAMTAASTQTAVGSRANEIDPSTLEAKEGTDLGNYDLSYEPGELTVTPGAGVSVQATRYEGFYDGVAHTVGVSVTKPEGSGEATVGYALTDGGPFVPLAEFAQQKDVTGDGPVTVYVRASVPGFAEVTASATVTVRARPVTLAAGSATKPFDGTPLVCGEWSVKDGGETPGYGFVGEEGVASLAMTAASTQTAVGSRANEIDPSTLEAKAGTDLGNYDLSYEPGELTVTPGAGVSVQASDYVGAYDGVAHTVGVSVTKPEGSGEATVGYALTDGGPFVPLAAFGQQKDVTRDGPVTVYVKVSVPNFAEVTASANVAVTAAVAVVQAKGGEKPFDRTPLTVSDYTATGFATGEGVASLKMTADSTITAPGTCLNAIDEASVVFLEGTDPANYVIRYLPGVLTVTSGMDIEAVDTFEGLAAGMSAGRLPLWSGEDALVTRTEYEPPVPPGFVTTLAPHSQVLDAMGDEAVRSVPSLAREADKMDVMVCACRASVALEPVPDGIHFQIAMDEQGHLCLWHLREEDGVWTKGWTTLSEATYADGEWIRVEADFDYASNPGGDAFVCVRVNGSCQPTSRGVRSPTDVRAYGPWHCVARGGIARPTKIGFMRTEVDDLMLCKRTVASEHEGPTEDDGVPFGWFDANGLPRDSKAAAPLLPGYSLGDVFTAGLDPYSNRPFGVTGFRIGADGRPHIEFNGYKGGSPVGYQVLRSDTPDFGEAKPVGAEGTFDGDASTWSTTWEGKSEAQGDAGFYKVEATR